jgi:hypothetical protein
MFFKWFRIMLQVFHLDVAKVDLNVARVSHALQVFYLNVAFSSRVLECSMQCGIGVAAVFFSHN